VADELLGRLRAELPAVGGLGEREQFMVSAWLTGLRSPRTRRAYAGDVVAWLAERGTRPGRPTSSRGSPAGNTGAGIVRRRPYEITAAGQAVLAEQLTTIQQIVRVARLRTATAWGTR
jgi:hypothetical protein